MHRIYVLLAVFTCAVPLATYATVIDTFEDGDYTANPSWSVVPNPGVLGEEGVVADPLQPSNLVLRGHGDETGHHVLKTPTSIPWSTFDASIDILEIHGEFSQGLFLMRGEDPAVNQNYCIVVNLKHEPGWTNVQLRIDEFMVGQPGNSRQFAYFDVIPAGEWWRMHTWYDAASDLVRIETRTAFDDALLFDYSFTPIVDLASEPAIDHLMIGFEEPSWSYMDNVRLVPEPSSLAWLALGAMILRHRP